MSPSIRTKTALLVMAMMIAALLGLAVRAEAEDVTVNGPPVASITVQGDGGPFYTGKSIILLATGSSDPDGDPMTFSWVMPDGSARVGEAVSWTPDAPGTIRFQLKARDQWGLVNVTSRDIDVVEGPDQVARGSIRTFLLLMVPLGALIILAMVIIAVLRGRRMRKLERVLEEVGVVHRPQFGRSGATQMPEARVLDLEPVTRVHPTKETHTESANDPEARRGYKDEKMQVPEYQLPPRSGTPPRKARAQRPDHRTVSATLECPSCAHVFRERMDPSLIGKGSFKIRCPRCGMEGDV